MFSEAVFTPLAGAHETLRGVNTAARPSASLFKILKDAFLAFNQDKAPRLSAAIAYYAMFSIAPILLLGVALLGKYLASPHALDQLFGPGGMVVQTLGADNADALRKMVPDPSSIHKTSTWATWLGFGTLFMAATGLFVQIQDALNSMWGADPGPPQGLLNVARTRLLSFVMILIIGVLLMVFLGLNTYLAAIATHMGEVLGLGAFGAFGVRLLTFVLSALFLTPVFAGIYKLLPAVKLEWREVWVGGAVTAFLFTLGQLLIGIYFGRATTSVVGAAGTLLALLTWIYYSAMIFFFGAEVTWVYSQQHGTHAGGAANSAKKQALNAAGANLDMTPGQQELEAAAAAKQPAKDARGRVLGLPAPRLPRVLPQVPSRAEGRTLPTVRSTLWNALSAIFAIPAVIFLRLLGLTGGKRRK